MMDAENAEEPPRPVRKAKRHRRKIPSDPGPLSYADQIGNKRVSSNVQKGDSRVVKTNLSR